MDYKIITIMIELYLFINTTAVILISYFYFKLAALKGGLANHTITVRNIKTLADM
jgi:hypothetical protein